MSLSCTRNNTDMLICRSIWTFIFSNFIGIGGDRFAPGRGLFTRCNSGQWEYLTRRQCMELYSSQTHTHFTWMFCFQSFPERFVHSGHGLDIRWTAGTDQRQTIVRIWSYKIILTSHAKLAPADPYSKCRSANTSPNLKTYKPLLGIPV